MIYGNQLLYAILPVIFAGLFNAWKAGLLIGLLNLIQGLILNPTAGNLSDKIGCKPIMLMATISAFFAGIFWIMVPLSSIYTVLLFGILLFSSYTLKNLTETYLLRVTPKDEGGIVFGLGENIYAIAFFAVTLSIPFFIKFTNGHKLGIILTVCALLTFIFILLLKNDKKFKYLAANRAIKIINPFQTIKNGLHFIKKNQYFPLLIVADVVFESIFYGTIWFVFPLHLLKNNSANLMDGLILGIYEVVTILFAGYIGHLADKYNWKKIAILGWLSIALGVIAMPFYSWPIWLIIVGFIIAFGNNLAAFSAFHALAKYNIDHKEDGAFIAFKYMVSDVLYALTPALVGILYFNFGFSVSLITPVIAGLTLSALIIKFVKKLK